ncbi:MAG TPA: bifunctional 4-hydroxy-2-oxoglutarate aldolase/2-dehydro-3-deoxy-phosphogluconate aldolase [Microlunatus sp.]
MSLSTSPLGVSPIIPVVVIDDPAHAVPLALALLAGGVAIIEVTLRTPRALDAVAAIAAEVPEIALEVGSVLTAAQVDQALAVGSDFLVSPGASPALLERLVAAPVPVLPGVATVSEVLTALDHGLAELKFFPAGPAGGPAYLAAIGGPVPQVRFCPTGGVTATNLRDYLAVPGVAAVGGTWLTPKAMIGSEDWAGITALAAAAVAAA